MAVNGQRFMTKTQHYRKITKPLLERKRRARMNLYLDELKELIVDSMAADGEHIAKLEKADILELTVSYLREQQQRRQRQRNKQQHHHHHQHTHSEASVAPTSAPYNAEKYCAGYTQAAYEVSKVFATLPGVDFKFGTQLLKHLGGQLRDFKTTHTPDAHTAIAAATTTAATATKPKQTPAPAPHNAPAAVAVAAAQLNAAKALVMEDVWRPW